MKQKRVPTRVGVCPLVLVLLTILIGVASNAKGQMDALAFSESRLREGEQAYLERRFPEAIDQLRVAAFGLMDHPALLSQALVLLSLSQDSAGRPKDARATVNRFGEVERRFPSYAKAQIDRAIRADFEGRFRKIFPELFRQKTEAGSQGSPPVPGSGSKPADSEKAGDDVNGPPAHAR